MNAGPRPFSITAAREPAYKTDTSHSEAQVTRFGKKNKIANRLILLILADRAKLSMPANLTFKIVRQNIIVVRMLIQQRKILNCSAVRPLRSIRRGGHPCKRPPRHA